jgi:galactokinase
MNGAWAPGRVNLVGEHTDYNAGLCLPFAIARGVRVEVGPAARLEVVDDARPYVRGVLAELGVPETVRVHIGGDLPIGAGLSSSAALCVALALALGGEGRDPVELARLCSRVENEWAGTPTGLLDQLAILHAREGHAVRLDLRSLEMELVPLELGEWRLAVLGSGVPHGPGYRRRREECAAACAALGVASLRDAPGWEGLPSPLDRRVRHVVTENERVERTVAALRAGDLPAVGVLLDEAHASLRDDYDASVPEVEDAVRSMKQAGAAGARMVGGGFGGAVLGLFPPGAEPPTGAFEVRPGPGARRLPPRHASPPG